MAELNPPAWLQGGSYDAQLDRNALAALLTPGGATLAPRAGVRPWSPGYELAVRQAATPTGSVVVDGGHAVVAGTRTAAQGAYLCTSDGPVTRALAQPHASLPRRDLIVVRVYDAAQAGTSDLWAIEALTGTPAASPAVPAVPDDAFALAEVSVPANASGVTDADITDRRTYTAAGGGFVPCTSTTRPAAPHEGMAAYETDTGRARLYEGAEWRELYAGDADTGWQQIGRSGEAGWATQPGNGALCEWRERAGQVWVSLVVVRVGGAISPNSVGNLDGIPQVLDLSGIAPPPERDVFFPYMLNLFSHGIGRITPAGMVQVLTLVPAATINKDDAIRVSLSYPTG